LKNRRFIFYNIFLLSVSFFLLEFGCEAFGSFLMLCSSTANPSKLTPLASQASAAPQLVHVTGRSGDGRKGG